MAGNEIAVEILPDRLVRDPTKAIARFFWPGSQQRACTVIDRVLDLEPGAAETLLQECLVLFGGRHDELPAIFEDHYEQATGRVCLLRKPSREQRRLIGAYFTMEYTYASAAFFNPSMVPAISQEGVVAGSVRFVMSLRAVGEGHVSSIVFRTGILDERGAIRFDPVPARSKRLRHVEDRTFRKGAFLQKLVEAGAYTDVAGEVLDRLGDEFALSELAAALDAISTGSDPGRVESTADMMMWLARSNYRIMLPEGTRLSEMVLFPISENESNGVEDMRLVRFQDDGGARRYYGTYTAYNGSCILPQLMEASGDGQAEVHTLGGRYAANKGMALFPRRIGGWYAMVSRHDGENMYLLTSDNVRFWNSAVPLAAPKFAWEFIQVGNCGSPLETDAGWLLLTHGVGPMRQYTIGAALLDRDDPSKVLGRLESPLIVPGASERGGYVPNVVYSCGGMIHNGRLVIPYGVGDVETAFATVSLSDLLERLSG